MLRHRSDKERNPTMKRSELDRATMSPDAYAGFLKLWITPANEMPERSAEVAAYLRHLSDKEPLELANLLDELDAELARGSGVAGSIERAA
jgi:hypothetical protein